VPRVPEPWESGFKDTVIAYPRQVTRVKATFDAPGQFVWHCHILEHEDNEMMCGPTGSGRSSPASPPDRADPGQAPPHHPQVDADCQGPADAVPLCPTALATPEGSCR
jgi:hypothetical protein